MQNIKSKNWTSIITIQCTIVIACTYIVLQTSYYFPVQCNEKLPNFRSAQSKREDSVVDKEQGKSDFPTLYLNYSQVM